jgi:hypothetical protein
MEEYTQADYEEGLKNAQAAGDDAAIKDIMSHLALFNDYGPADPNADYGPPTPTRTGTTSVEHVEPAQKPPKRAPLSMGEAAAGEVMHTADKMTGGLSSSAMRNAPKLRALGNMPGSPFMPPSTYRELPPEATPEEIQAGKENFDRIYEGTPAPFFADSLGYLANAPLNAGAAAAAKILPKAATVAGRIGTSALIGAGAGVTDDVARRQIAKATDMPVSTTPWQDAVIAAGTGGLAGGALHGVGEGIHAWRAHNMSVNPDLPLAIEGGAETRMGPLPGTPNIEPGPQYRSAQAEGAQSGVGATDMQISKVVDKVPDAAKIAEERAGSKRKDFRTAYNESPEGLQGHRPTELVDEINKEIFDLRHGDQSKSSDAEARATALEKILKPLLAEPDTRIIVPELGIGEGRVAPNGSWPKEFVISLREAQRKGIPVEQMLDQFYKGLGFESVGQARLMSMRANEPTPTGKTTAPQGKLEYNKTVPAEDQASLDQLKAQQDQADSREDLKLAAQMFDPNKAKVFHLPPGTPDTMNAAQHDKFLAAPAQQKAATAQGDSAEAKIHDSVLEHLVPYYYAIRDKFAANEFTIDPTTGNQATYTLKLGDGSTQELTGKAAMEHIFNDLDTAISDRLKYLGLNKGTVPKEIGPAEREPIRAAHEAYVKGTNKEPLRGEAIQTNAVEGKYEDLLKRAQQFNAIDTATKKSKMYLPFSQTGLFRSALQAAPYRLDPMLSTLSGGMESPLPGANRGPEAMHLRRPGVGIPGQALAAGKHFDDQGNPTDRLGMIYLMLGMPGERP